MNQIEARTMLKLCAIKIGTENEDIILPSSFEEKLTKHHKIFHCHYDRHYRKAFQQSQSVLRYMGQNITTPGWQGSWVAGVITPVRWEVYEFDPPRNSVKLSGVSPKAETRD